MHTTNMGVSDVYGSLKARPDSQGSQIFEKKGQVIYITGPSPSCMV